MTDIGEYAGTPPPKVSTQPTWNAKDNPGENPWTREPWGREWSNGLDSESTVDPMSRSKEPLRLSKQYPICDCLPHRSACRPECQRN